MVHRSWDLSATTEPAFHCQRRPTIALLHIAFQEGFADDMVAIRLNGQEVFRKPKVSTRLQTGYADSFETETAVESVHLEIEVASRQLRGEADVKTLGPTYVGVSVSPDGGLTLTTSPEPFGYL